jgi:hypothetical protein
VKEGLFLSLLRRPRMREERGDGIAEVQETMKKLTGTRP